MNAFSGDGPYAFRGPFAPANLQRSVSVRSVPIPGVPGPVEEEIPISQLPLAGPILGAEDIPIVQNGVTCRTTTGAVASQNTQPIYMNKVLSLIYIATAGQTSFSCSVPDQWGNIYTLTANGGLQVTAGGLRLAQDNGSGFGGYTINLGTNSVVFLYPRGAGDVVIIDIYALTSPG